VDTCYRLVGLVRATWKGFDGGREARQAIDGFFADLRARSRPVGSAPAAAPTAACGPPAPNRTDQPHTHKEATR
ncbi:DUF5947 family protein, partial [Streptomonospora algeriensis]